MQSVYLANQTCWSPTDMFTQELNMQILPFSPRRRSFFLVTVCALSVSLSLGVCVCVIGHTEKVC